MKESILNKIIVTVALVGFVFICFFVLKDKENEQDGFEIIIVIKNLELEIVSEQNLKTNGEKTLGQILDENYLVIWGSGSTQGMVIGFENIISSDPNQGIWFIYYVNEEYATVGINQYYPSNNDYIEFILEQY